MIPDYSTKHCDIGGDYRFDGGGNGQYREPCQVAPTWRWHRAGPNEGWAEGWVPGHWNYRCDQHIGWLTVSDVVKERL